MNLWTALNKTMLVSKFQFSLPKSIKLMLRGCKVNGFGWNITIHGNKAFDINRKASRSVIELSIEPIFNLYFW